MPENPRSFILGLNVPPAVPPGFEDEAIIGFSSTAAGPALLVSIVGAPIVIAVDLDLANDEVAIGGPDSGSTRRLFLGVFDGAANNILAVTSVAGFPVGTTLEIGGNVITALFDLDSGAGTEWNLGVNLRFAAAGGSVEAGTAADPIRTDPTGTTTQPVSGTVAVGPTVTPGTGATNLGKAEDQAFANGDVGVQALAVRRDADAPDAADGDYTPLHTNANGRLKVDGGGGDQFARDSAAGAADLGTMALAVRKDAEGSSVGADGDYTPAQVDANGHMRVGGSGNTALGKAQAQARAFGDVGVPAMTVRNDYPPGPQTGVTDSYQQLQTDETGRLYTTQVADRAVGGGRSIVAVAAVSVALLASSVSRRSIQIFNRGPGPLYINQTGAAAIVGDTLVPRGSYIEIEPMMAANGVTGISNAVGCTANINHGSI